MDDSKKADDELNRIFRTVIAFSKNKEPDEIVTDETRAAVKELTKTFLKNKLYSGDTEKQLYIYCQELDQLVQSHKNYFCDDELVEPEDPEAAHENRILLIQKLVRRLESAEDGNF